MRFFYDTEFIEDGKTIDLISIGIVSEDGREYYAESSECDLSRASEWVEENVVPHLVGGICVKGRKQIADEVLAFVGHKPEFWAYYADYDWVALCQLYGRMIDLPKGWPTYCRDLKQYADQLDSRFPPNPVEIGEIEHHALGDARTNLFRWKYLKTLDAA